MRLFDYKRASALMEEFGLDLLLASSMSNVGYLLDYYAHGVYNSTWLLDDGSMFYRSFVGLPADEGLAPFYTPWVGEAGHLSENEPWVHDRRFFGATMPIPGVGNDAAAQASDPVEAAASAIRDRDLASSRIGVETASLPVDLYKRLIGAFPEVHFVDVGPVLARLRSIKCAEEIRRMRRAAAATEKAITDAYESVREGSTELDFNHQLKVSLAQEGAWYAWAHVAFGPKGAHDVTPRDVTAEPGVPLRVDAGGGYGDYICDMSRVGAMGDPDPKLLDAMGAVHETYIAVRGAVKAGAVAGELHELGSQVMQSCGYRLFSFMVGHGIGRDAHEWPFVVKGSEVVLEAGMTICVEIPLRIQGLGSINIEDVVQVTEDGCESITTLSPELYRIP